MARWRWALGPPEAMAQSARRRRWALGPPEAMAQSARRRRSHSRRLAIGLGDTAVTKIDV
ncbi:hypothetical protein [Cylindrospermum sp. FACHB-282]|uniref:hypothetical protein n=1 Tax=Cylindrospermum sp. FACHB-282 TaxID=2692794 RepID=UPI00168A27C8|nr:hypothetical protein [Cylindrospermum sp. FACHB-282]MBD2388861.1 hypothetical protein [Cylindrospermum sp. FACHB-282]